jgi:hypothetical protein
MCPNQQQRLQTLKKFVKSLVVVGFFGLNGFTAGAFLGGYYLMPTIKPHYVNGLPQLVCGMLAGAAVMTGAFFGAIGYACVGIHVARQVWWRPAQTPFKFGMGSLIVAMVLITFELCAIGIVIHY